MSRRPAPWHRLFTRCSTKIFLLSWVYATLSLIAALVAATIFLGHLHDSLDWSMLVAIFVFPVSLIYVVTIYAVPSFLVASVISFANACYPDVHKSEGVILTIVSLVYGLALGLASSGSVIAVAYGAVFGFISAVVALIMTKDLRLASHADELS